MKINKSKFSAVNWNKISDPYSKVFWDQNVRQFWVDEEINLSGDKITWQTKLNDQERDVYEKVLTGLTLLDTHQGAVGMSNLALKIPALQTKAVIQFMGFMEQMHAKSYSSIFSTLSSSERIEELFQWVEHDPYLQQKVNIIINYYTNIETDQDLYMAMVASVFLESFLFYSGFFYPLLLAGNGLMIGSVEIINLIVRDESIHGLYIGTIAQNLFKTFDSSTAEGLKLEVKNLLLQLLEIEIEYTKSIYTKINLVEDVITYIKYNANKAMSNLGFENFFDVNVEDVNPIVLNGLNTNTKNHDFFSTKGNGYIKSTKVVELQDEDFIFDA